MAPLLLYRGNRIRTRHSQISCNQEKHKAHGFKVYCTKALCRKYKHIGKREITDLRVDTLSLRIGREKGSTADILKKKRKKKIFKEDLEVLGL